MEIFVYNPAENRETLESFNKRVSDFCLKNPVSAIQPSVVGPSIILSVSKADDLGAIGPCFSAEVHELEGSAKMLEEQLDDLKQQIASQHKHDDMRLPCSVVAIPRTDDPTIGYAVFLIVTGTIEEDDGGD